MDAAEFDKFADEYRAIHARNIALSGESPDYFAEYKIRDILKVYRTISGDKLPPSILDFGGGVGTSIPFLRRYAPDASVACIDVSSKSLEIAKNRFGEEANFKLFDGATVPFPDGTFALALAACVFHHIDDREHVALLRELYRVLLPGGVVVIFEHNPYNPVTRYVVNTCPFDANARLISARTMKRTLISAGFPDAFAHYRLFFPAWFGALRPLERFLMWLPLGAQYYVAAQK